MDENSKKRSRKSKLVPREGLDSDDENIAVMQKQIEDTLIQIKNKSILKKLSSSPQSKPLEFSIKVEVEEIDEVDEVEDNEPDLNIQIDSVTSLSNSTQAVPTLQKSSNIAHYVIPHDVIRNEFDKLLQETTSTADKIIEINVLNYLGKKKVPLGINLVDEKLQNIFRRKWKSFRNSFPNIRDIPLMYKCYVCNMAWWYLYDFREHVLQHQSVLSIDLETNCHECNIIAYQGTTPAMRDIWIDSKCWRCGKTVRAHFFLESEYQTCTSAQYYRCKGCMEKFYTCRSLCEHESNCSLYNDTISYPYGFIPVKIACSLCPITAQSNDALLEHMVLRHSVRCDVPVDWHLRTCGKCDTPYHLQALHDCPYKTPTTSCDFCLQKFKSHLFVLMHLNSTQHYYPCRICDEPLRKQCMELEHLMEHTDNYVKLYKCIYCSESILFPDLDSVNKHKLTSHRRLIDDNRNLGSCYEMVVVPKRLIEKHQLLNCLESEETQMSVLPIVENTFDTACQGLLGFLDQEENKDEEINTVIIETNSHAVKSTNENSDHLVKNTVRIDENQKNSEHKITNSEKFDISCEVKNSSQKKTKNICRLTKTDETQLNSEPKKTNANEFNVTCKVKNSSQKKTTNICRLTKTDETQLNSEPKKTNSNEFNITCKVKNSSQKKTTNICRLTKTDETQLNSEPKKTNSNEFNVTCKVKNSSQKKSRNICRLTKNNEKKINSESKKTNTEEFNINCEVKNSLQKKSRNTCKLTKTDEKQINSGPEKTNSEEFNITCKVKNSSQKKSRNICRLKPYCRPERSEIEKRKLCKPKCLTQNKYGIDVKTGNANKNQENEEEVAIVRDSQLSDKIELISQPEIVVTHNIAPSLVIKQENPDDYEVGEIIEEQPLDFHEIKLENDIIIKQEFDTDVQEDIINSNDIISIENNLCNNDKLDTVIKEEPVLYEYINEMETMNENEKDSNEQLDFPIKKELDELSSSNLLASKPSDLYSDADPIANDASTASEDVDMQTLVPEVIVYHTYGKKMYKCKKCPFEGYHYAYKEHLKEEVHMRARLKRRLKSHTPKTIQDFAPVHYTCTKCNVVYRSFYKYVIHFQKVHDFNRLTCPKCMRLSLNKLSFQSHVHSHIKDNYVTLYLIKNKEKDDKNRHQCKTCGQKVSSEDFFEHWEGHLEITKRTESWKGYIPEMENKHDLKEMLILLQEMDSSSGRGSTNKLRDCHKCQRRFERKNECKRHFIEHLLVDAYKNRHEHGFLKCQICGQGFYTSERYKRHMRDHGSLPLYKCELCDKAFSDSSNFSKHKKVHNLSVLICDICNKKFTGKIYLEKHMLMHQKIKPLVCKECGRVFYSESSYRKHMSRGKIRVKCTSCDVFFSCLKEKWDHMWEVHKERKFQADCPLCERSFRKHQDVKKHIRYDHANFNFKYVPNKTPLKELKRDVVVMYVDEPPCPEKS